MFLLLEVIILGEYFKRVFLHRSSRIVVRLGQVLFLIIWMGEIIKYPLVFPKFSNIFEYLVFLVFIVLYFYERLKTPDIEPIYQKINFWISVGLFIYFSGNLFAVITANIEEKSNQLTSLLLGIFTIVTITKNVILSLALLGKVDDGHANKDELVIPDDVVLDDFKLTNLKKH